MEEIFQKYCQFGNHRQASLELDGTRFAKLIREAGLIDGKMITACEVDICFNRVKGKGARRINYAQFKQAVELLSQKNPQTTERLLAMEGPQLAPGTTVNN